MQKARALPTKEQRKHVPLYKRSGQRHLLLRRQMRRLAQSAVDEGTVRPRKTASHLSYGLVLRLRIRIVFVVRERRDEIVGVESSRRHFGHRREKQEVSERHAQWQKLAVGSRISAYMCRRILEDVVVFVTH